MGPGSAVGTLLMACCITSLVRCETNYTLLMPSQAVAGRTSKAQLTVFYSSPQNVSISIKKNGVEMRLPGASIDGGGAVNELSIDIPDTLTSGDCTLLVGNDVFRASVGFKVTAAPYAILIQTDKPIYKPSQTVNIRVAIIDDNLIPKSGNITVLVEDAEGNKLQLWRDEPLRMGLAQFSLPLSDRPPLGEWMITASTDEKDQEKTIKIDEYVLPRFEVTVDLPSYVLVDTKEITASVSAQYTFGENVVGEVSIIFETEEGDQIRKSNIQIDGRAVIRLNTNDVGRLRLSSGALSATAEVYEPLSGKTLSGSSSTDIAESDYTIKFLDINSKIYLPGQMYTAYFDVARPDGARIKGESNVLVVTAEGMGGDTMRVTVRVAVPDSGIVPVKLTMPSSEYYSVKLTSLLVLEDGQIVNGDVIYDLTQFSSMNRQIFLQASANIATVPLVGDSITVNVSASDMSGRFYYVVTARGQVVHAGFSELTRGSGAFNLRLAQDYTPQAYVVVYAVIRGELLADSMSFNVEGAFQNEVTLEFQNTAGVMIDEAEPSDEIKVKVDTDPGSTVGLLSVDKSVLLLGGGNDITQSQILTELLMMVKPSSSACSSDEEGGHGGFAFFPMPRFGGKSTEDILSNAGLSVSTDGDMAECMEFRDYAYYEEAAYDAAEGPPPPSVDDSDSGGSDPPKKRPIMYMRKNILLSIQRDGMNPNPPSIHRDDMNPNSPSEPKKRLLFPETWLWDLVRSSGNPAPNERGGPIIEDSPPDPDKSKPSRKRRFFPETWLWDLVMSGDSGSLVLDRTVPDTITSWVSTAISMNPNTGIAVTARSTELTVKLPFFINGILPYSAVKGEELLLKIVLNNYGDTDDVCTVTVDRSEQYEVKVSENDLYLPDEDLQLLPVSVPQGAGAVVSVWLNPRVIDSILLSVSSSCTSGNSDAFERELLIKPSGYPQETCESEFIQIESGENDVVYVFDTKINTTYVEDSKRVQVQVTGDVMGPSIEGLERLVQMPYGCGEQNMISFTPNIFVRRYLKHNNDLDNDMKLKTTEYMFKGYQRELTYRHGDGSFSAFGELDGSGSTWLTAFVMKCFRQAKDDISIDENVMQKAKEFLMAQISTSSNPGKVNEPGRVIHTEMQGGSTGEITLSAFVVIAMLEDVTGNEHAVRVRSLSSTISFLEGSLSTVSDNPYQLSIITYALQLAESGQADVFLERLESHKISSAGMVWWSLPKERTSDSDSQYFRHQSGPSAVEMSSYALLTYLARSDISKAKAVAMWLTKNRGSSGGFFSTQDTVLGLQALATYAEHVVSNSTNLRVNFTSNIGNKFGHTITVNNAILTRKNSFKPADGIQAVTATLSGVGSAIITTCTGYNVATRPQKPTTVVTTSVSTGKLNSTKSTLNACISYIGDGASGMGLMQVKMATGFSAAVDGVVAKSGDLARTESTADGLALYWNTMTSVESCVNIQLVKDSEVKGVKDSYVVGSQYYSTESGSRAFYNPSHAKLIVLPPPSSSSRTVPALSLSAMCTLSIMLSVHIFYLIGHY